MALPITFPNANNENQREPGNELTPQALRAATIDLSCTLPHSELTKLYRMIETALPEKQNRIVQFASVYEDNSVSKIAFETAVIAAQLIGKRVLFIDTSMAQPVVPQHKLPDDIGIPLDTLLLTARPPHEALVQAEGTELYFAMLRDQGENDFSPISLSAIESAFHHLRASFDMIVVDSQHVMTDAFGMALAKLVDGSILVVEAENTRAPVAIQGKRLIEAGGGRVIGAVMNKRRFYIPKFLYRLLYRNTQR